MAELERRTAFYDTVVTPTKSQLTILSTSYQVATYLLLVFSDQHAPISMSYQDMEIGDPFLLLSLDLGRSKLSFQHFLLLSLNLGRYNHCSVVGPLWVQTLWVLDLSYENWKFIVVKVLIKITDNSKFNIGLCDNFIFASISRCRVTWVQFDQLTLCHGWVHTKWSGVQTSDWIFRYLHWNVLKRNSYNMNINSYIALKSLSCNFFEIGKDWGEEKPISRTKKNILLLKQFHTFWYKY